MKMHRNFAVIATALLVILSSSVRAQVISTDSSTAPTTVPSPKLTVKTDLYHVNDVAAPASTSLITASPSVIGFTPLLSVPEPPRSVQFILSFCGILALLAIRRSRMLSHPFDYARVPRRRGHFATDS